MFSILGGLEQMTTFNLAIVLQLQLEVQMENLHYIYEIILKTEQAIIEKPLITECYHHIATSHDEDLNYGALMNKFSNLYFNKK